MRYVSEVKPVTTELKTSLVPGLSSVHAVKPIHSHDQTVFEVTALQGRHKEAVEAEQEHATRLPLEDRRKACRRIHFQKVLIELRSGVDRRKHDLFASGVSGHIDEKA